MDFDADYILEHYLRRHGGIEYIHYPAERPTRLLVTFSAQHESGHFQRIRQFWSPTQDWGNTAYLFFHDPANTWYADTKPFSEIIASVADSFVSKPRIVLSGSCMGACGALLCGLRLPADAVFMMASRFPNDSPPEELSPAVVQCASLPVCYIEARGLWPDQEALKYVTDLYRNHGGRCFFHSMPESQKHWAIDLWRPAYTMKLLDVLEMLDQS